MRSIAVGERVEGRRQTTEVSDDWTPARLVLGPSSETDDHGRRRLVQRGQLLCASVEVLSSDMLDVESVTVGHGRWRVTGQPVIVVTRRLGRASVVPVERLAEPPSTEVAA